MAVSIACNSPENEPLTYDTNELLKRCGTDVESLRVKHGVANSEGLIRFPFTGRRKLQSTIISNATGNGGYDKRLLCKGHVEKVLTECSHYVDAEGMR